MSFTEVDKIIGSDALKHYLLKKKRGDDAMFCVYDFDREKIEVNILLR